MQNLTQLYETDYDAWFQSNLKLLRQARFSELDLRHLIEELEDMSKKSRRELANSMVILLAHLLKWQYQPTNISSSWRGSILEQRLQIRRELKFSPSLKPYLPEAIEDAYPDALKLASKETGIKLDIFPQPCNYPLEDILDEDYFPASKETSKY